MTLLEYQNVPFQDRPRIIQSICNSLENCESVGIDYELDIDATEALGEQKGEWRVEIYVRNRHVSSSSGDFYRALTEAYVKSDEALDAHYHDLDQKRKAALTKLSFEERKLLGLTP